MCEVLEILGQPAATPEPIQCPCHQPTLRQLALFERGHSGVRLTAGGRAVMLHVRRALAELDAARHSGSENGSGDAGEIRLGVRLPPIGKPIANLLSCWRERHANVVLTVSEMNDRDLAATLEKRRLDVALTSNNAVWHHAMGLPLYRARLLAALPVGHHLAELSAVDWDALRDEVILVQGWDASQVARELYASFLGDDAKFRAHAASKQSVFALVGAGFGVTLATASQSEVAFPDVVFKPIDDPKASIQIVLAWLPTEAACAHKIAQMLVTHVDPRRDSRTHYGMGVNFRSFRGTTLSVRTILNSVFGPNHLSQS